MTALALALTHAAHILDRRGPFRELQERLRSSAWTSVRAFTDKMPNYAWAAEQWAWGAEQQDASHVCFLQDDAKVPAHGRFASILAAMLAAVPPTSPIGLEAAHPAGRDVARLGGRFYTTADMMIGVGYVLPVSFLRDFLSWQRSALYPRAVERISEDDLIAVYCLDRGIRIVHPVPTPIDHLDALASTYGNDFHPFRRPSVTWEDGAFLDGKGWTLDDLERPDFWKQQTEEDAQRVSTPHLGRFYEVSPWKARQWVRGWTDEQHKASLADVCPEQYRKWIVA